MHALDWVMVIVYFGLMVGIGWWSHRRVKTDEDFFIAGGRMPWWLAGISHHVSGYSAVLFVAYAGVAYSHGITVYFWGFASIGIGVAMGAWLFAARWNQLREKFGATSPLEFLARRCNVPTQQALAWSGATGPISVPLLLGMLPWFRRSGSRAALLSWGGGLGTYAVLYYGLDAGQTATGATPILVSLALFIGLGALVSERTAEVDGMLDELDRAAKRPSPVVPR